jgi:hypothetical protein
MTWKVVLIAAAATPSRVMENRTSLQVLLADPE